MWEIVYTLLDKIIAEFICPFMVLRITLIFDRGQSI